MRQHIVIPPQLNIANDALKKLILRRTTLSKNIIGYKYNISIISSSIKLNEASADCHTTIPVSTLFLMNSTVKCGS